MFKVRHVKRQQEIISLDTTWSPDELREWTYRDELVCPGCNAAVNYRKQGVRQAHFAHRTLMGCDYADGDSAVIAARALLWGFFREKVGQKPGWKVDLEVPLSNGELIDVWVHAPGDSPVAYKVFSKGRRWDLYDNLKSEVHIQKAELRPILISARREWANDILPDIDHALLLLPAADRHMRFWRKWDRYHVFKAGEHVYPYDSVCYIDHEAERLMLYRNLRRPGNCNPAVRDYEQALEAPIRELLVWHGELIFPEEREARTTWDHWVEEENARLKKLAEEEAERRRLREEEIKAQAARWKAAVKAAKPAFNVPPVAGRLDRPIQVAPTKPIPSSSRDYATCRHCGQNTWDWWERQGNVGTCNACRIRARGQEPQICKRCRGAFVPSYPMQEGLCTACRSVTAAQDATES